MSFLRTDLDTRKAKNNLIHLHENKRESFNKNIN